MFQPFVGWSGTMADSDRRRAHLADVRAFVGEVFGADLHVKPDFPTISVSAA